MVAPEKSLAQMEHVGLRGKKNAILATATSSPWLYLSRQYYRYTQSLNSRSFPQLSFFHLKL